MSLPSLPFDVLFAVFRDLDVVDVIRIGMTCKVIREAAQERHVWIDQLEKLRRENPIFKLATPPLTSLSTWELKTLVTGRTKLRLRLNDDHDDLGFARKGMTIIPEHCNLLLLPGGKYLIVVQFNDIITLRRIELEDDQVSLPVLTHIDSDSYFWVEPDCSELLTTTSPCPMLVFGSLYEHSFFIYRLDHHNGEMILETAFRMSNGHRPLGADGQGRVIGFMVLDHIRLARAIVIHLDHPDTVMESDVHHYVYHTRWKISIPTEGLMVIYNDESILACKIPNFSSSPPGVHLMNLTKMWSRPRTDQHMYMTSDPVHDPLSAREFNLYFPDSACCSKIVTVTIPIGASDGQDDYPSPKSDGLPVLKQITTVVEEQITVANETYYFIQRGLYARPMKIDGGSLFRVIPLKGLASHGPKGGFRFSVSDEELHEPETVQIDEASGRVVIGKWLGYGQGVKILIGDLV